VSLARRSGGDPPPRAKYGFCRTRRNAHRDHLRMRLLTGQFRPARHGAARVMNVKGLGGELHEIAQKSSICGRSAAAVEIVDEGRAVDGANTCLPARRHRASRVRACG